MLLGSSRTEGLTAHLSLSRSDCGGAMKASSDLTPQLRCWIRIALRVFIRAWEKSLVHDDPKYIKFLFVPVHHFLIAWILASLTLTLG